MRIIVTSLIVLLVQLHAYSQSAEKLIADIQKAQRQLKTISYTLQRTDTFVTGQVRTIHGQTIMQPDAADSVFGFLFWSKRDDLEKETIYDGRIAFSLDNDNKTYDMTTKRAALPNVLGTPGGQVVFKNLAKLDTSGVIKLEATEDKEFFYLTLHYPDIKEYDVTSIKTQLTIDKKMMLPVRMRKHQETLGKVQDLYYQVKEVLINDASRTYDFLAKPFLNDYSQIIRQPNKALMNLIDKEAPPFELISFTNTLVSSGQLKGKILLLDFWEVWCGPCIISMPKVQALYKKYMDKGLVVYGISCEKDQIESAKKLVEKRGIDFPMLAGNDLVKQAYKVNAVPLYILINKAGKISYLTEGYSNEIETAIQKALSELLP